MMIQEVSFQQQVVTFTTQSRPAATAPARPCADSVSLSPEAQAGTKAEMLAAALDADKDGAISDKEFIDGGTELLRPASHRRHPHDQSDNGVHRGWYGSHRLEHRLERIFDKVDANGDGTLDAGELTSALSAAAPPAPKPEETATEPPAEASVEGQSPAASTTANEASVASPSRTFTAVTFQFTFVSIAVRQYQVSGQEQTAAPPPPQLQAVA
jgi:Ca2+-binding EF-hand superfamily protein